MDFRVTEDQQALQEGIRSFCEGSVTIERLQQLENGPGFDRDFWKELAEMGVFSLRLPENEGGVGLGVCEAVLVFEELGRFLTPGPLVWSHLAAGLVEGAADGSTVVGGLDLTGTDAAPYVLEHLDSLDVLLVLRRDGVYRVDPKSIEATALEIPFDPLTPVHRATGIPQGDELGGADESARLRLEGALLASGQLLGIAEQSAKLATDYAKGREQFNRPIGSFQAVKHILADMFTRQEVARAAVYAAAATMADPRVGDVTRAVAAAKINAGEGALKNTRGSIQVHGGMGFTWEVTAHYYWKRAWVLEESFGTVDEHADGLAEKLGEAA
ncbi:MAG: acyl-CoA dehydrogenase family protein [Myxococcota bacterium]|nr:acyl-CoA dehydrogenase family protein [Myxococcota bacterium]